ncbi:hypothetical protein D3C78_1308780 [compost metagenome]
MDRLAGNRIYGVRITHAVLFEVVAIIPRGGDRHLARLDHQLRLLLHAGRRPFNGDTPRFFLTVVATSTDLTANIHHVVLNLLRLQILGNHIHPVALGDRGEIDIQLRNALYQCIALHRQFVDTGPGSAALQFGSARHLVRPPFRAKTPQINQRPDGHVQRTVGDAVNAQRLQHHLGGRCRYREGFIHCAAGVEAAQFRAWPVGGHLVVHQLQPLVDLRLYFGGRRRVITGDVAN